MVRGPSSRTSMSTPMGNLTVVGRGWGRERRVEGFRGPPRSEYVEERTRGHYDDRSGRKRGHRPLKFD